MCCSPRRAGAATPRWHADPFTLPPPAESLLTPSGAEHGLGGAAGPSPLGRVESAQALHGRVVGRRGTRW
ncbi:hypothetical protein GCM10023257_72640 [Streptomyces hyderabadensis]|uniref:Uncharacterized protein n=1 Tax=Streptomyces hyderabadensis TaxID=598549 RepID=A0ABP9IXR8_9ACTN